MRKYYMERKGLLKDVPRITFKELLERFGKMYRKFDGREYFVHAFENEEEVVLLPTPDLYFQKRCGSDSVWPILKYYWNYSEAELFTVMEILYDHIAIYDEQIDELDIEGPKEEYAKNMNSLLEFYKDGYYLEPTNGYIMKLAHGALQEQLATGGEHLPKTVHEKVSSASEQYYHHDANMEAKKQAINTLAGVLEHVRGDLQDVLNEEYSVHKKDHDKLIFEIVNNFSIRHNRADQKTEYSKEIWYDWMMQYYTSVIIAYYRLTEPYAADASE